MIDGFDGIGGHPQPDVPPQRVGNEAVNLASIDPHHVSLASSKTLVRSGMTIKNRAEARLSGLDLEILDPTEARQARVQF